MVETVLFLILLAGPNEREVADALAVVLEDRLAGNGSVVIGREANERLEGFGVQLRDLMTARNLGPQLTQHQSELVILHLEQREMLGDQIIECQLWFDGRAERAASIAGEGQDPLPGLLRNLMPLINHRLPASDDPQAEVAAEAGSPADLPNMVEAKQWATMLATIAAVETPSARECYYQVMAYVRLGRRDAAIEAFANMQKAHGQHFLVTAAQQLLPPAPSAPEEAGGAVAPKPPSVEPEALPEPVPAPADPEAEAARDLPADEPAAEAEPPVGLQID